jgi:hypothetical protein
MRSIDEQCASVKILAVEPDDRAETDAAGVGVDSPRISTLMPFSF